MKGSEVITPFASALNNTIAAIDVSKLAGGIYTVQSNFRARNSMGKDG